RWYERARQRSHRRGEQRCAAELPQHATTTQELALPKQRERLRKPGIGGPPIPALRGVHSLETILRGGRGRCPLHNQQTSAAEPLGEWRGRGKCCGGSSGYRSCV